MFPDSDITFNDLLNSTEHFITIVIHYILYLRDLYPPESFDHYTIYDLSLPISRSPLVVKWVEGLVQSCMEFLRQGKLSKLLIALMTPDNNIVECYVINTAGFPKDVPSDKMNIPLSKELNLSWYIIKNEYRSCIISLKQEIAAPEKQEPRLKFTISIETEEPKQAPDYSVWMPIKTKQQDGGTRRQVFPIGLVDTGPVGLNIWREV